MIEVNDLSVRFGGVVPIDRMTVTFAAGTCGLIGPNGAGKTTFFNVLSGFVRPSGGRVIAFGEDLLAMPDFKRARWGLRRTFQTEQAIANLSVYENVLLVHEHSGGDRKSRRDDVDKAIAFVGLDDDAHRLVGVARCARQRRSVETRPRRRRHATAGPARRAGCRAARGRDRTTSPSLIRRIPEETGALVILVDHDMSLVSACCATTAVLDFGRLIASGETAEVLRDDNVIRAYLGTEDVA